MSNEQCNTEVLHVGVRRRLEKGVVKLEDVVKSLVGELQQRPKHETSESPVEGCVVASLRDSLEGLHIIVERLDCVTATLYEAFGPFGLVNQSEIKRAFIG